MKLLLSILLLISTAAHAGNPSDIFARYTWARPAAKTYYVATNGNDSWPGSITQPFATWKKLNSVLVAGDTAYIRGGTYTENTGAAGSVHVTFQNLAGNSSDSITIKNFPGEIPKLDLSAITPTNANPTALMIVNCTYVHFKGLEVANLKQQRRSSDGLADGVSRGIEIKNSNHCKLELINLHDIGGYGLILAGGADWIHIFNCDFHHMDDRYTPPADGAWGNANGIQCTGGTVAIHNKIEGCRIWWISDDGLDLYQTSNYVEIVNCWSFRNGYIPGTYTPCSGDGQGFKLGPDAGFPASTPRANHNDTLRRVTNCLAFHNKAHGFDQNRGDMRYKLFNNTSYANGEIGFRWDLISPAPTCSSYNNLAYKNGDQPYLGAEIAGITNSWNAGVTVTDDDFKSLDTTGVTGPRQPDGSLPRLDFLQLKSTSDLKDAGTNVGLPFDGSAPAVGAYDYATTTVLPSVAVSADFSTIKNPKDSVTLTATPSGVTPFAYSWVKVSGPSCTIVSPSSASTKIRGMIPDKYVFRVTVTDALGSQASNEITITVEGPGSSIYSTEVFIQASLSPDKKKVIINMTAKATTNSKSVQVQRKNFFSWGKESGVINLVSSSSTPEEKNLSGSYAAYNGVQTYRVKIIDRDGKTSYSNEVQIRKR